MFQVRPGYTPGQVKKAFTACTLDTEAVGTDVNSGFGIAMANGAVNYALADESSSRSPVSFADAPGLWLFHRRPDHSRTTLFWERLD